MRRFFALRTLVVLLIFSAAFQGCKKDEDPLPIELQSVLLAGVKGQSKSWRITKIEGREATEPFGEFQLDNCFLDNVFTFSNNAGQVYESREGLSKCDSSDPDLIERGSWFLTFDGQLVIISANEVYSDNGLFGFFGLPFPANIESLTEEEFVMDIILTEGEFGAFTYRLTFERI